MTKNNKTDCYFIDKSFIDEKNSCIHVPVQMYKNKTTPDIDVEVVSHISNDLNIKYGEFIFTGRWDVISGENGIKEYTFFYQKPPKPFVS